MTLKDYLALPDVSAARLAETVGVSASTIWRAAEGRTVPSRKLMTDLFEATDGKVTPNDFYGVAA